MWKKRINKRQLWLWLIAAMIAPLATVMSGQSWVTAGLTAAVCAALCWTVLGQIRTDVHWSKWFCVVQWIWLTIALSQVLNYLPMTWPQARYPMGIVLILLLTALWAVRSGSEACSRAGTTLFWLVSGLMVIVLIAAVKDIKIENIKPSLMVPRSNIFFVLLIPCAAVLLPRKEKGSHWPSILAIALIAVVIPFVTAGTLSPEQAAALPNPFHELSRALTISGAAQRFEALVSAGLTISWFLLLCMLLCVAAEMAKAIVPAGWGTIACAAAAAVLYLCDVPMGDTVLAAGSVLFWGLLPVLTQGVEFKKRM